MEVVFSPCLPNRAAVMRIEDLIAVNAVTFFSD
jgi:hypothetical protein